MVKSLIVVSGNLAVGKTTFATQMSKLLDWHIEYESVIDNPYLEDFYKNMKVWSFHLQIYFLGHRTVQHLAAFTNLKTAILDRSIYEDANIFAKALNDSGCISERDYSSYLTLYNHIIKNLPVPNLMVYIKAPIETIMFRIKERGQEFDKNLSKEYLTMIDNYYNDWIPTFDLCPIVTINSDEFNFNEKNSLLEIKEKLLDKLNNK